MYKLDDKEVRLNVQQALAEDIGIGDITATLITERTQAKAVVISREPAVICGRPWFDEVFRQLDPEVNLQWHIQDGYDVQPGQPILNLQGKARSLLTGERCALNFMQTLSGTATRCNYFARQVAEYAVKLLDTRKTLPGLRQAQKYAVRTGNCFNHRMGLYDAFLIKENHIAACGSITAAIMKAKEYDQHKTIEIEVETEAEFIEAMQTKADVILLDNFSPDQLLKMVTMNQQQPYQAKLEASGGITLKNLRQIAATGVDYISLGTLTKDITAIDLSMRLLP